MQNESTLFNVLIPDTNYYTKYSVDSIGFTKIVANKEMKINISNLPDVSKELDVP